ncbi:DUF3343 domain-containing protein [Clostridium grantii]|uniref:Putative Se/S carrier protein-like domain-containing protein n=1 Tax=Clostridium grantii DSM 8605 TaxID=1121316 RepID=A0A1M5S2L6_9CLOT|nr:DUF3343 domain-containing protein [Clostridium grantii]SHH32759.1 Protein of unknown function [Clostridium grantii DSM 8605]
MDSEIFYVISFDSTNHAMQTEKNIMKHFEIAIIPTPREITRSCGLSIKIFSLDIEKIIDYVKKLTFTYGLYSVSNKKIDGKRKIKSILVNE